MTTATNGASPLAPPFAYARLLRKSHELIAEGKGDTPEAEELAEQMDQPWFAMTEREQQRLRGLSADLYALQEGGPKQIDMSPNEVAEWRRGVRDAYLHFQEGDVDAALAFFRQPIPCSVPRHAIRFFQGRCWEKLGDLETALLFMRAAEREDPQHGIPAPKY